MSDTLVHLVPSELEFVPGAAARRRALELAAELAFGEEELRDEAHGTPQFFDCGANLDSIRCPVCRKDFARAWGGWMEAARATGFRDRRAATRCCGSEIRLEDVLYNLPCAFGRYALVLQNPRRPPSEADCGQLGKVLGYGLVVVHHRL